MLGYEASIGRDIIKQNIFDSNSQVPSISPDCHAPQTLQFGHRSEACCHSFGVFPVPEEGDEDVGESHEALVQRRSEPRYRCGDTLTQGRPVLTRLGDSACGPILDTMIAGC
jgi:hypothetical protein